MTEMKWLGTSYQHPDTLPPERWEKTGAPAGSTSSSMKPWSASGRCATSQRRKSARRQTAQNLIDKVLYEQPKSIEQREELAQVCVLRLNLKMPMLLDNISNEVDGLYAALPDRLYLLDEHGVVAFRTVVGSPGFDADAWHTAIRRQVGVAGM